ncbi:hypothetical protein L9F63_001246 [Diploptera punctata]|uniref:BRISC complex subunit FAM175B helical domain-containing protein n=1 Tax=Diploptera punctata TaxID=6984 RepID=A0AAD8A4Z9_DIPPU|nr:hypothetical protein L9F63_001246 [Diploptera punctata]
MAANVYVRVSGPALSFLLYENVKSPSDQEGFLLGEVLSHVTDTISDSQMRGEKTETLISVNSLMPIPSSLVFYNGIGKINHEKLKQFLKGKQKEVVGWYCFRRNCVLGPHLRDKLLHKELCAALPHLSAEHLTLCLLNTTVSSPGSTHLFNHKFLRHRHRMFEAVPVQIHNLGEAPQSEYKVVPSTACLSNSFHDIISSLRSGHDASSDASLVCNIQKALQEHLRSLIRDVELSDKRIADLEMEIDSLRLQAPPLSNEVLLPEILKDDTVIIGQKNACSSSKEPAPSIEKPKAVPSKPMKNTTESNHIESNSPKKQNSPDVFDFVTDMKIEMSQPQKRPNERGRGRGAGRGFKNQTDSTPNNRHTLNKDTNSPVVKSNLPNINNLNVKTRMGYAQAVKKLPGAEGSPAAKNNCETQKH